MMPYRKEAVIIFPNELDTGGHRRSHLEASLPFLPSSWSQIAIEDSTRELLARQKIGWTFAVDLNPSTRQQLSHKTGSYQGSDCDSEQ